MTTSEVPRLLSFVQRGIVCQFLSHQVLVFWILHILRQYHDKSLFYRILVHPKET